MTHQMTEAEERQALADRLRALRSSLTEADCAEIDLVNLRLVVAAVQDQHDLYQRIGLFDDAT